jgi:hypothetical protein
LSATRRSSSASPSSSQAASIGGRVTARIFGCVDAPTVSPSPQSSSCSFSPGRTPVNSIAMSLSGSLPDRRIMFRARSTIETGSPMSSTNTWPLRPIEPAWTISETASGIVMKNRVISGCVTPTGPPRSI